jgi:hypothetical protein
LCASLAATACRLKKPIEAGRGFFTGTEAVVVAELRQEVRALKDANKALTLYVSKIVDRVCQQEGFAATACRLKKPIEAGRGFFTGTEAVVVFSSAAACR